MGMTALIQPPNDSHFLPPNDLNAPTGLLPVILPIAVSDTIIA